MSLVEQYDIGRRIRARLALGNATIAAASSAAPSSSTGVSVDRQEAGLRHYYSCKAIVSGAFTAGSSLQTVTMGINVQHSSDGTSWDAFSTATKPSDVTWGSSSTGNSAGSTGGTEYDTIEQPVSLQNARRYLRVTLDAPTFATSTSGQSLAVHGVLVFGGADELPANAST